MLQLLALDILLPALAATIGIIVATVRPLALVVAARAVAVGVLLLLLPVLVLLTARLLMTRPTAAAGVRTIAVLFR